MKLKKIAQILLVSCSVLALGACSSTGTNRNAGMDASVADANAETAQAGGAGDVNGFGGSGDSAGMSRQQLLQKRTYYFDFNSDAIHDGDKAAIFANANNLVAHPNTHVIVEGHTDPRGSREYNVALGERRANAVADLLKSKGVNAGQIRVVSYGAERLAAPGRSEQDFQLDRRVVLVYQR